MFFITNINSSIQLDMRIQYFPMLSQNYNYSNSTKRNHDTPRFKLLQVKSNDTAKKCFVILLERIIRSNKFWFGEY